MTCCPWQINHAPLPGQLHTLQGITPVLPAVWTRLTVCFVSQSQQSGTGRKNKLFQPIISTAHTESISSSYRLYIPKVSAHHTDCTYRKYQPIIPTVHTESINPSHRLHIPKVSAHHTDYTYRKYQSIIPTAHTESISPSYIIPTTYTKSISPSHRLHQLHISKVSANQTYYTYRMYEYNHEHHAQLNTKVGSMYNVTYVYSNNS